VRTHGWAGKPPRDDDEAVRRILDATRACIDRDGSAASIVDVAAELGVTRQTVYRYYRTTEELLVATAIDATAGFLDRLEVHLSGHPGSPADVVVEGIAFTLERLPHEPYLGLLLTPGRISLIGQNFTSRMALSLGRTMIERLPVDWAAHGFDSAELDELVELALRITHSFVVDPGTPPRSGLELRGYLTRWIAPAITANQPAR
jgi:AcrR family transcriptional regulator